MGKLERLTKVRCNACTEIVGCKIMVGPKLGNIEKRVDKRKAMHGWFIVVIGEWYMSNWCKHARNKCLYSLRHYDAILD
jgi:hypothetical protein